jgi:hypothetical protein
MMITTLIILAIGIWSGLLAFVLIVLILYFIIPNRKFTVVSENEIDEEIKILNFEDRLSFNYKNVKVSLKRDNDKLLIEPYFNKIIESLLRILGFFLAMFLLSPILGKSLLLNCAISYFFSKIIRKKVLNKLLIWKHKKNWKEFYFKYEQFRYEDLSSNNDDDNDDDAYVDEW